MELNLTTLEAAALNALNEESAANGHDFGILEDVQWTGSRKQLGALVTTLWLHHYAIRPGRSGARMKAKRGPGRPPLSPSGESGQRYQVTIPPSVANKLRKHGKGSLSQGIVKASANLAKGET